MRKPSLKIAAMAGGAALLLASGAALASHGKAGLWEITVTMGGSDASHMPDMSKLPPEAQAAMRAHGVNMSGNSITVQHCRTAEELSLDKPPPLGPRGKNCAMSNVVYSSGHMTADMTCTGSSNMSGHVDFDWDSDEHFVGHVMVTGTANGTAVTHEEKLEGRYLSASCGGVTH